ncbi:hypothetical protein [Aestuariibacter salexigens]|uniref:hypothetical protein n=1 Tax=Aestuariibacter salexigens TaxID=226010 RepID=UPI00047AA5EA|nr:hypothetical protein [Aestuariibacter salexigens]
MSNTFTCWQCGATLNDILLPLSRREICTSCHTDLHSCRMCQHFCDDGRGSCNEDRAEWVSDRERANFCDYFTPSQKVRPSGQDKSAEAKAKLAELFGDQPDSNSDSEENQQLSPAELAEKRLRDLLNGQS